MAETIIGFSHIKERIHVKSFEITEQRNLLNGKEFLHSNNIISLSGLVFHTTKQMLLSLYYNSNKQ